MNTAKKYSVEIDVIQYNGENFGELREFVDEHTDSTVYGSDQLKYESEDDKPVEFEAYIKIYNEYGESDFEWENGLGDEDVVKIGDYIVVFYHVAFHMTEHDFKHFILEEKRPLPHTTADA